MSGKSNIKYTGTGCTGKVGRPKANKHIPNPNGAPSKKTEDLVTRLEEAFRQDCTVEQACLYAGVAESTYYLWMSTDSVFERRMKGAQMYLNMLARKNIVDAIATKKSIIDSWKFLEKREKSIYSDRKEITGKDGQDLIEERKDKISELLSKVNGTTSTVNEGNSFEVIG